MIIIVSTIYIHVYQMSAYDLMSEIHLVGRCHKELTEVIQITPSVNTNSTDSHPTSNQSMTLIGPMPNVRGWG